MQVKSAVDKIIQESGLSKLDIAKSMGKNPNFVYALVNKQTDPSYRTLVSIADTCGYDLLLRNRVSNNEIIIDPPNDETNSK